MSGSKARRHARGRCHCSASDRLSKRFGTNRKAASRRIEDRSVVEVFLAIVLVVFSAWRLRGRSVFGLVKVLFVEGSNAVRPLFRVVVGVIWRKRSHAHREPVEIKVQAFKSSAGWLLVFGNNRHQAFQRLPVLAFCVAGDS